MTDFLLPLCKVFKKKSTNISLSLLRNVSGYSINVVWFTCTFFQFSGEYMRCFKSCNYEAALLNKTIIISTQIFSKPTKHNRDQTVLFVPALSSAEWLDFCPSCDDMHSSRIAQQRLLCRQRYGKPGTICDQIFDGCNLSQFCRLSGQFKCMWFFWPWVHETDDFQHPCPSQPCFLAWERLRMRSISRLKQMTRAVF